MSNPNEENQFGGVFNFSLADSIAENQTESGGFDADPDFYRPRLNHPNLKESKVYKAKGRFVPNPLDGKASLISKWIYFLQDPDSSPAEGKFYVDCPSNEGKNNNIISLAYRLLKDNESVSLKRAVGDNFKRKLYNWALFYIMQDKVEPELNGKIKIFRFSKQVMGKISLEDKPEELSDKKPCNVFDPFTGKNFMLIIDEVNDKDNNRKLTSYEKSKFGDVSSIIEIPGQDEITRDQKGMKIIYDFLKKESPDLSKAKYKAWDAQTEDKVIRAVREIIGSEKIFDDIYFKAYKKKYIVSDARPQDTASSTSSAKNEAKPEKKKSGDGFDEFDDDKPTVNAAEPKAEVKKNEPKPEKKKETGEVNLTAAPDINFDED